MNTERKKEKSIYDYHPRANISVHISNDLVSVPAYNCKDWDKNVALCIAIVSFERLQVSES